MKHEVDKEYKDKRIKKLEEYLEKVKSHPNATQDDIDRVLEQIEIEKSIVSDEMLIFGNGMVEIHEYNKDGVVVRSTIGFTSKDTDDYREYLDDKTVRLLEERKIDHYRLNNSKSGEIAFVSYVGKKKRREFEIKQMNDCSYRLSTRFLGYVHFLETLDVYVEEKTDPDGKRCSYRVFASNWLDLNIMICKMLEEGYSDSPLIKLA